MAPPRGDVRTIDFRAKHIPGSEHFKSSEEMFSSLRPDDEIVVYCTSVDCHASIALYHELVARGYRDVGRYEGGLTDWEGAGLPLDAPNAATSAVVTRRHLNTPAITPPLPGIRSFRVTSPARTGSGTTRASAEWSARR